MSNERLVEITHRMKILVGDDGRMVELLRTEDDMFRFEWQRPDEDGSAALLSTKVQLSAGSFIATAQLAMRTVETLHAEEFPCDELSASGQTEGVDELRRDAERYRTWRDAACYRAGDVARALCECITPSQIDEAIDKLN